MEIKLFYWEEETEVFTLISIAFGKFLKE